MVDSNLLYAPFGLMGGILTILCISLASVLGSIFMLGPILPFMFVWPWLFRRVVELVGSTWQTLLVAIFEKVFGTKIVFCGDSIGRHEKTVVLMNHRTRLDWMYFFSVVFHSRILNRQKIALKSVLKWLPGFGWAMQVGAYIFLDRSWETDQGHIEKILSYFMELDSKPNILFFPEGTDLSESNKIKSQAYAKKNDLPLFEYVLQPRTKGFTYFVNTLRNVSGIHAVHDVTVAYPYNIPTGEQELLKGEVSREVHFHIKRYSIEELPEDEEALAKWCQERWEEKEEMLREYYSVADHSARKFISDKCPPYHSRSHLLWFSLFAWFNVIVLCIYLLVCYAYARWYALMMSIFYISVTFLFGGFEKMEMTLYDLLVKPSNRWGLKDGKDKHGAGGDAVYNHNKIYGKYLNPSND